MMKRITAILLMISLLFCGLFACNDDSGEARLLSFAEANSIDEMEKLDGKKVSIIGYMSTLSPVDGKFMYLMNLPYQSCPFCVPNTNQLSNTMAVYAKDSEEFEFTDRAIRVTGILDFGDYTDEFGYEYGYRIKDAKYEILNTEDMSEELKLWQSLASSDVVADVYSMFDYASFVCYWPTYTMTFAEGKDYLYPTDALKLIETDGAQYNYGFEDGYFDSIIARIKSVDENAFADLITIIEKTKTLCEKAYSELKAGNYTETTEYSNQFGDGRSQFKLDSESELDTEFYTNYKAFSVWLGSWEI